MSQATRSNNRLPPDFTDVSHLDQYFGTWSIYEPSFRSLVKHANSIDLNAHINYQRNSPRRVRYDDYTQLNNGLALIEIRGTLTKYGSSLAPAASVLVRRAVRNAADDHNVSGIMLKIDSPGGTVAGVKDIADDVAAAAKQKPLHAYIEDLGACSAYWVASQATRIYSNPTALIGGLGTFAVLQDFSKHFEQQGIKVHILRAGEFKGAGVEGSEITQAQLSELQRRVNTLNDHFLQGVASGRRLSLSRVRSIADGKVHIGTKAATLGLIDGVKSFDDALSELATIASNFASR